MKQKERIIFSVWKKFYPQFSKQEIEEIFKFINTSIFSDKGMCIDVANECILIIDFARDYELCLKDSVELQVLLELELEEIL